MSAHDTTMFGISASGTLYGGITTTAPADFSISTNLPSGELIVTVAAGDAPATFGISTNLPDLTASLSGDGTADFGIATGTSTLIADGIAVGEATFGFTADWVGYATGAMSGTTADSGVTIDGIVQALEAAVLPVDVVKVNSYTVQGDGQSGSEWGPV